MHNRNIKTLVTNALVAALYVALYFIAPQFTYGPIQCRISEGLNHLNAFNHRYKWGVMIGVFISNFYGFMNGLGWYDIVFGTSHTLLAFMLSDFLYRFAKDQKQKLHLTTLAFTVMIFIIAIELRLAFNLPFWPTYLSLMMSEAFIMTLTAPLMRYIDRRIDFNRYM